MSAFAVKLARLAHGAARAPRPEEACPALRIVGPSALPFDAIDGAHGPIHVHADRIPEDGRVGRLRLGDALHADLGLLAGLSRTDLVGRPPAGALHLDVEATGLGGGTSNCAFMVGMAWFEPGVHALSFEQLLLRDADDEAALLARVRERIEAAAWLVSYNGKSFDLPLLRARMVMARLCQPSARPHVDLLHVARRVHRRAFALTLGSVERRVLGFDRGPDIRGEEVARRYALYLRSGDDRWLGDVARHNRHDVLSLVALSCRYGACSAADAESRFGAAELCAIARALCRAGDHLRAARFADRAVMRSADAASRLSCSIEALWTRALCARGRGDKSAALADLERAHQLIALPAGRLGARREAGSYAIGYPIGEQRWDPAALRLELAKLYEHFARAPRRALCMVAEGTGEPPEALHRRRARLLAKVAAGGKSAEKCAPIT